MDTLNLTHDSRKEAGMFKTLAHMLIALSYNQRQGSGLLIYSIVQPLEFFTGKLLNMNQQKRVHEGTSKLTTN